MRLVSVVRQDQGPDAPWHWVTKVYGQSLKATLQLYQVTFLAASWNLLPISIVAYFPTLRPIWMRIFHSSPDSSVSRSSQTSRIITIGGSGPSSGKQNHNEMDESLLASTIDEPAHSLRRISGSSKTEHKIVYAPKNGIYTARVTFEGYELDEMSSPK